MKNKDTLVYVYFRIYIRSVDMKIFANKGHLIKTILQISGGFITLYLVMSVFINKEILGNRSCYEIIH